MSASYLKVSRIRSAGFSLIELMVSLTIGLVLIGGAVFVYQQSRTTYALNESTARLQEEARYALSMIEPDVQLAGYYGFTNAYDDVQLLIGTNSTPATQLEQSDAAAVGLTGSADDCGRNFAVDLMMTVQGSNNTFALGPAANAPGAGSGCAIATPSTTSDTLTIRRASTRAVAAQANRLQMYINRLQPANQQLFVNGVAPGALVVGMREIRDLIVRAYYVAQNSDGRAGYPALRVISLGAGEAFTDQELIPGVEDLQVQFGIDTGDYNNDNIIDRDLNGNGIPDGANGVATRYVNPDDPILGPPPGGRSAQIVTVRLWLRLRSELVETGFVDGRTYTYANVNYTPAGTDRGYRRVLVTRTIYLRNARTL